MPPDQVADHQGDHSVRAGLIEPKDLAEYVAKPERDHLEPPDLSLAPALPLHQHEVFGVWADGGKRVAFRERPAGGWAVNELRAHHHDSRARVAVLDEGRPGLEHPATARSWVGNAGSHSRYTGGEDNASHTLDRLLGERAVGYIAESQVDPAQVLAHRLLRPIFAEPTRHPTDEMVVVPEEPGGAASDQPAGADHQHNAVPFLPH